MDMNIICMKLTLRYRYLELIDIIRVSAIFLSHSWQVIVARINFKEKGKITVVQL